MTCEWDGKLSAALLGGVALFGRLNTAHGRRWVQVAVSDSIEGAFSAFEPIRITGWNGCRVRRASIYYMCGTEPRRHQSLIGLFPHARRKTVLPRALVLVRRRPLVDSKTARRLGCSNEAGRVHDYPADGFVVRGVVYYYVHRDMPTSNLVSTGTSPGTGPPSCGTRLI